MGRPKKSWITLKRHLFKERIPKKLSNAVRPNEMNDREGEFEQEIVFRRVTKILISMTSDELAGMNFADYGRQAAFPHLPDTFPRYSVIVLLVVRKGRQMADKSADDPDPMCSFLRGAGYHSYG